MDFRIDVYAWIPQPDVPNPLYSLPGGAGTWGPGASGPRFGGDNFTVPPAKPSAWAHTYRARQSFAFSAASFGDAPKITTNTGVMPGTTTVLTAPRSSGGTVCYSITATVKASSASVTWSAGDDWYEAKLKGKAQDPVPAAVAGAVVGPTAAAAASAATPVLAWDLVLRFQRGTSLGFTTKARYTAHSAKPIDVSASIFPKPANFGGTGNLFHGLCTVRRFPSYVVYVTTGGVTIPVYFADASGRNLGEIVLDWTDPFRQLTF